MKKSWILIFLFLFAMASYAASSWEKGKKAYDKGEYGEAISYFLQAAEAAQQGDYFRWLGVAYYKNGQFQEAVNACKQALTLAHAKDSEWESWLWLAEAQEKLGLYDAAIPSWKKYVELKPDDSTGFARLSQVCGWNKQYDEAITAAKRAIELKADNARAYYCLGYAYRMKKQYDQALQFDKKAIEIDPAGSLYPYEMGHVFYVKDEYAEAVDAYKKALVLEPDGTRILEMLALSYRLMGRYDDAITTINKLIALQSYSGIGISVALDSGYPVVKKVLETGPARKAGIEAGDKIIKINGNKAKGWNIERADLTLRGALGTQVVLTIERQGANESIEKTVSRETMFGKGAAFSLGLRSDAFRQKGSLEAALQDAQKAYAIDPANSWARYSLGASYLDQGQYTESIRLLAQVKDSPRARVLEATAYAKQGKMNEAENIYCSIPEEEMSPKNIPFMNDRMALLELFKPLVKEHMSKVRTLEARGRYQEALPELSEALKTAAETEAQAIQESIFSMLRRNPSLAGVLPEEARRNVLRGEMLVKEASFEKAAAEFKQAIRIAPYAARLYYNLALVYAELKKYPEAIRQMKTYLQAMPDAPDARAAMDQVYKWEFMMEKKN